eukprot:TRINITY_DN3036_c0_g2_i1.p1 TRINITY_DN3036_c0_g2~~TRINITY_DN3036_c0_g2_i1.p1  ORF type:complete len:601 (+),score=161.64 TRINITY_DN3036_c0_g2_i1:126-1928(+)
MAPSAVASDCGPATGEAGAAAGAAAPAAPRPSKRGPGKKPPRLPQNRSLVERGSDVCKLSDADAHDLARQLDKLPRDMTQAVHDPAADVVFVPGLGCVAADPQKRPPKGESDHSGLDHVSSFATTGERDCTAASPMTTATDAAAEPVSPDPPSDGASSSPLAHMNCRLQHPKRDSVLHAVRTRIHFQDLATHEEIGKGQFGTVIRVVHKHDGKNYALKTMPLRHEDPRRVLRAELERLKQSKSRFSVQTYEAYYSRRRSTVSFLMDLMDFGSLERCVQELQRKGQRVSEPDLAHISWCCLSALSELRMQHIIHKDVKPDNILVGFRGEVKLGDFGISSFTNQDSNLLATGSGSFKWMAPERIQSPVFSYNSDVYSLGLSVAYISLGRYPLKVETCPEFLRTIDEVVEVDLTGFAGSEALRAFIRRSTLKLPAERPEAERLLDDPFIRPSAEVPTHHDLLSFLKLLDKYDVVEARRTLQLSTPGAGVPHYHVVATPCVSESVETIQVGTPATISATPLGEVSPRHLHGPSFEDANGDMCRRVLVGAPAVRRVVQQQQQRHATPSAAAGAAASPPAPPAGTPPAAAPPAPAHSSPSPPRRSA